MANAKWSGIEQWKYGLTASWYVSEQYGHDNDVDGVGLYNASTNPLGHGGKTRPFATIDKWAQETSGFTNTVVLDSGYYITDINHIGNFIGDGRVIISSSRIYNSSNASNYFFNIDIIDSSLGSVNTVLGFTDCFVAYTTTSNRPGTTEWQNTKFVECNLSGVLASVFDNNILIRCTGSFSNTSASYLNCAFIDCEGITLQITTPRPVGVIKDYCTIIGTVKTSTSINGKTTGVSIEDFNADGNYFGKSYSEVDLWGNASGSGASVAQLQEIFNNYFSPIYIDDFYFADFTLKPTVDDRIRYGGLNGKYIGAHPVAYAYSADTLWNTYRDAANTSNLELSNISGNIKMQVMDGQSEGTFRSLRIDFPQAITCDPVRFANSLVYDINGVAQEKVDYTDDPTPDNTLDQRSIYDFKLATAPSSGDAMGALELYELNREPTIDAGGNTNMDDNFDPSTASKQTFQSVIIEFKLKKL